MVNTTKSKKIYQKNANMLVADLFNLLNKPLVEFRNDSVFFFNDKTTKYLSKKKTVKDTNCA